jgi:hypothetical protein
VVSPRREAKQRRALGATAHLLVHHTRLPSQSHLVAHFEAHLGADHRRRARRQRPAQLSGSQHHHCAWRGWSDHPLPSAAPEECALPRPDTVTVEDVDGLPSGISVPHQRPECVLPTSSVRARSALRVVVGIHHSAPLRLPAPTRQQQPRLLARARSAVRCCPWRRVLSQQGRGHTRRSVG